jgi:hypothetical protein
MTPVDEKLTMKASEEKNQTYPLKYGTSLEILA